METEAAVMRGQRSGLLQGLKCQQNLVSDTSVHLCLRQSVCQTVDSNTFSPEGGGGVLQ